MSICAIEVSHALHLPAVPRLQGSCLSNAVKLLPQRPRLELLMLELMLERPTELMLELELMLERAELLEKLEDGALLKLAVPDPPLKLDAPEPPKLDEPDDLLLKPPLLPTPPLRLKELLPLPPASAIIYPGCWRIHTHALLQTRLEAVKHHHQPDRAITDREPT